MFEDDPAIEPIHHGDIVELPPGYVVKIDGFPFALVAPAYLDNKARNFRLIHRDDRFDPDSHHARR